MDWMGTLTQDCIWEGDVSVVGDVVVPTGKCLSLAPGTRVSFAASPRWSCSVFRSAPEGYPIETSEREACDIVVQGRLEAQGTRENPVVFGVGTVAWGGFIFLQRGSGRLQETSLRSVRDCCLQAFDDSVVVMSNCRLEGAAKGITAWGMSCVRFQDGIIHADGCAVIACEGSRVQLCRSSIEGSRQGFAAEGWALLAALDCRFVAIADCCASAKQSAWLKLRGCQDDAQRRAIVEGGARLNE
jgi:hypothetical protein